MKKHDNITLTMPERLELASIQKHPGMDVLVEKIVAAHARQELQSIITDVQLDDPDRHVKIEAIASSAYAMQLTLDLIRRELEFNWRVMQEEELRKQREQNARHNAGPNN